MGGGGGMSDMAFDAGPGVPSDGGGSENVGGG